MDTDVFAGRGESSGDIMKAAGATFIYARAREALQIDPCPFR